MRINPTQDPIECSQVKRQEDTEHADSWKRRDRDGSSNSTCSGKPVRGVNTRTAFHNKRISNHQYLTTVFQCLQQKLGITTGYSTFTVEAIKTNVLIWGSFMCSSMKAAIHLGPNYSAFIQYHAEIGFVSGQSKSTCLLRLRTVSGEDVTSCKSNY